MSAAAAAQAAALEVTDSPEQPAGGDWGGSAQQQHASGDWGAASHQAMAGEFAAPVPRAGGWGAPQPPPQQQQHQQQSAGGDWGAAQNGWAVQDPEYQDAHRSGSGDAAGAYSARMNTVGTDAPHADPYDEYYDHGGYGAHRGSGVSQTGDGPGGGEESSGSYESAASHVDAGDWADLQDEVPKCAPVPVVAVWQALIAFDAGGSPWCYKWARTSSIVCCSLPTSIASPEMLGWAESGMMTRLQL